MPICLSCLPVFASNVGMTFIQYGVGSWGNRPKMAGFLLVPLRTTIPKKGASSTKRHTHMVHLFEGVSGIHPEKSPRTHFFLADRLMHEPCEKMVAFA